MAFSTQTYITISVRLDETNYPTWVYQMKHHLRGHGLLKFVDGSHLCPPQFLVGDDGSLTNNSAARERWMEQDSLLISMLTTTLSAEALTLVIGCQTSMEVWLTLKQRYAIVSEPHIMKLKAALQNIQKGSDSIDKYLLRFKYMRDRLAVAGVEMNDQDVKFLILAGLPSEYSHTRQIIRSKSNVDLEEVRSLLLFAEYEIELENKSAPLILFDAMLAQYGMYSGMLSSTCFGQPSGMQSNLLSSIGNHGVTQNRMCPCVTSGMTNVHQYNAFPATTQYGVFTPQHTMTASTCFAIPPTSATSPASFQHNFIPSSGNYQSMPSMGNDGFMMNNNMVNEGSYNAVPSLFDVSHQTSGFIAQNGSNMSLPFSHQQQHASTMNNCNYNSTPHQNATLSQQNFSHQTVQNDSSNNDYQQNGFINSFADGGYSDDSTSYPNFPSNKGTNNYNNRSNKNNGKPRTNGNFINVIVCQICEKAGHSAFKCYYRNCQQQYGASSSSVVCQICDKIGHPAYKCHLRNPQPHNIASSSSINCRISFPRCCQRFATRHQYDCQPPSTTTPQALSASICTQPKPPSIATQPTNNASQSQVVKSLPITPAFSLSVPTRPQLQQALLTKIVVLRTPGTCLLPSTLDRNLMNCRQACESSNSWRSLPLIPPG